jgi:hypothetical protein
MLRFHMATCLPVRNLLLPQSAHWLLLDKLPCQLLDRRSKFRISTESLGTNGTETILQIVSIGTSKLRMGTLPWRKRTLSVVS